MKKLSDSIVLIVDDTESNIDLLIEAIGDDYEISVATDGQSALEFMAEQIPDLVLLDIMMPGMSGYEVCAAMKSNLKLASVPVIFLTAMTDINAKTTGFEAGGLDYITKPFEILEVKARVNTHLSLAHAKNELRHQNQILEDKVRERTKEIRATQEAAFEAIASLAETRDPETGGHIKRTQNYIRAIADRLNYHPAYMEDINLNMIDILVRSSPLHDIGKIGIRDEVLLKPGKLTPEEFEEMKAHTIIGYNALSSFRANIGHNSFLETAMEIAKYHHEKWDGSGYPEGLVGNNIPLSCRIMALADVYDALISRRVYKAPISHYDALKIIENGSGNQFEPELVNIFLEISEEIRQIASKYADSDEEYKAVVKKVQSDKSHDSNNPVTTAV